MARGVWLDAFRCLPVTNVSEARTAIEAAAETLQLTGNPGRPVSPRDDGETVDLVDARQTTVPLRILEPNPFADRWNLRRRGVPKGCPHSTLGIEGVKVRADQEQSFKHRRVALSLG